MPRHRAALLLLTAFNLSVLFVYPQGSEPILPRVQASTVPLALAGNINGWNITASNPNPTITADYGDIVTIKLTSTDVSHKFNVDTNNDTFPVCSSEPCSPVITVSSPQTYSFNVNFTAGSYTYYCVIHPDYMNGIFNVRAVHDAAVTQISTSRNTAYNSVTANPTQVNVTARNNGISTDSFAVWAKANSTLIGNQTITVAPGATQIVIFSLNTQSLARGLYILTANATKITNDANQANNQYIGGTFTVKLKGDVSGDCQVDIIDLATVGSTFGKTQGNSGFNPTADLNNDLAINIVDLVLVAGSFGQTC